MPIVDALLHEYDHELATTRRVLERVPEVEFGWKPHDKSMTLGQLATHVASIPWWLTMALEAGFHDVAPGARGSGLETARSRTALLEEFDASVKKARASLARASDAEMLAPWTLKFNGQEIFTMPRTTVVRSFVLNHLIHHRGQLSVYLRLKDVPVPAIYGPTADEQ
jgi:uncharacterized damage-inducible protein DinB